MNWKRRVLYGLGAGILALIGTCGIGYVATAGEYTVPATVESDPALESVELNGTLLHVRVLGPATSPVIVILPGGPGNDFIYLSDLEALQDRYRLVFYDQRGAGLSARVPSEQLTLETYLADLMAVLDHYSPGRPAILLGHSWGAMLATAFTAQHPERVSNLVLAEPGFLTPELSRVYLERTNNMMPALSWATFRALGRAFYTYLHVSGPDNDAAVDAAMLSLASAPMPESPIAGYYCNRDMHTARLQTKRFGARANMQLMGSELSDGGMSRDLSAGIENFRGNTLLLTGDCNTIVGPDIQERHAALFPRVRLVMIEGAGHTMLGEKPEESLAAIRAFLAQ